MPSNIWNGFGNTYDEINQNSGGLADFILKRFPGQKQPTAPSTPAAAAAAVPPAAVAPVSQDDSPQAPAQPEKSYGAAGLAPYLTAPGLSTVAAPLAVGAAGMLAAPAAAAYGIGKLVAPKLTDDVVQKLKDFAGKVFNKAAAVGSAWETGLGESIPGSKFAETLLPQQAKDFISTIKNQHPNIATAGQVAGTVGQMALPGAAVLKGGGLLAGAGNAALNALPYAVGTGLDVGATTGDVGKGIMAGGAGEILGTALPTALHALSQIPIVSNFLAKAQLAGRGIRSGDLVKNLYTRAKGLGMTRNQADTFVSNNSEGLVQNIADLVGQAPPGRAGLQAIKAANSAGFEAHADLWDALTGEQIGPDDIAAVLKDPDLQPVISRFGQNAVEKSVNDMANELNGQGWTNARNVLSDYSLAGNQFAIKKGALSMKDPRILDAGVADAFHDRIDGTADSIMEWAKKGQLGPDVQSQVADVQPLHVLKSMYPATLSITKAAARGGASIGSGYAGGSDTAMRMLLGGNPVARAIGVAGFAGTAPGVVGDILTDPQNLPVDLAKMAGASFGGRLLNLGLSRGAEMARGGLAGALRTSPGPSPVLSRLLGMAPGAALPSPTGVPSDQGDQGGQPATQGQPITQIPQTASPVQATNPALTQAGAPAAAPASILNILDTRLPTMPEPAKIAPEHAETVQAVTQKEAQLSPQQVQSAQQTALAPFRDRVIQTLYTKWDNWQNPYKMDWDSFLKDALQKSGDLDPKNPLTAKMIAGEDYKRYLKSYQVALNLQNMGKDLSHVLSYGMLLDHPLRLGDPEIGRKRDELVNTLYTAMTGDMKDPDKGTRGMIEGKLYQLARSARYGGNSKRKLEQMLQDEYGVNFDQLRQYGLYQ